MTNVCVAFLFVGIVEKLLDTTHASFYGPGKQAGSILAKELIILTGRRIGASIRMLSELTGLDPSTVSRRHDSAVRRMREEDQELQRLSAKALKQYLELAV